MRLGKEEWSSRGSAYRPPQSSAELHSLWLSAYQPVKGKEGLGPVARSRGKQTWVRILTLSLADYVTLGTFPPPSQSLSFSAAKCEDPSTSFTES